MVSDGYDYIRTSKHCRVSIRFEVRGGFRPAWLSTNIGTALFQSALRFAVVSDIASLAHTPGQLLFQSALRFAVVSDASFVDAWRLEGSFQSALRFAVVSDDNRYLGLDGRTGFNPL